MRVEIAGAQITTAVVDIIDTLQNEPETIDLYRRTLRHIASLLIDVDPDFYPSACHDLNPLGALRTLQMIMHDLDTIASPADVNLLENDTPTASL